MCSDAQAADQINSRLLCVRPNTFIGFGVVESFLFYKLREAEVLYRGTKHPEARLNFVLSREADVR